MARTASQRFGVEPMIALVLTVVGAVTAVVSAQNLNVDASDALGLISALPLGYLGGVGLVLLSFVMTVRREHLVRPLLTLQVLTLIVLLYGLVSFSEDLARLPTTWVHAGFIEYIQRTGTVLTDYDARFVWPGFFAAGAMLNQMGGTTNQSAILEWAPLVLNLAFAVPVWIIAQSTGAAARTCWLAVVLFFLLNWVGQDYYSPQGTNFLLALCFLAVLLRVFFTDAGVVPRWANGAVVPFFKKHFQRLSKWLMKRELQPSDTPPVRISGKQKAAVVVMLLIIYAASVVSHQLTPFFLIITVVGLVLLDRVEIRTIPILMVVGVFVWISYAATSFWQGQLDQLFGDVGNLGNVFSQNVNSRVSGNPDHIPVIYGRLLLTAVLWLTAAFGFIRRWRRGRVDVLCLVGFVAPFSVLGGQAYGGEAVLRVYLFALPFAAILAASALAPDRDKWNLRTTAIVSVVVLALVPTFFLTRYGNESFEHFDQAELTAVHRLYEMAPAGSTLVALNSDLPWRGEAIDRYTYVALGDAGLLTSDVALVTEGLTSKDGEDRFLIVTKSQQKFAEMMQGQPPTWSEQIVDAVLATGNYEVRYENPEAQIIVPKGQS